MRAGLRWTQRPGAAVAERLCGVMRRLVLQDEQFRWLNKDLYRRKLVEYYRVVKADSVIALPIQADHVLVPAPQFRPGLGRETVDLPGGRVNPDAGPHAGALRALEQELGITEEMVERMDPLDERGWPVNSSFSNQKLFGYVARIGHQFQVPAATRHKLTTDGLRALLAEVDCLQCRAVLSQYLLTAGRADLFPR